ncbi:hypothetical protein F9C07_11803 [Aspergillus flavus]|uniref:MFS maltose permease n=1 Tax=Aspergillus flavus (strain ATCC 200026 / FGSC A1120 / IAM 13836 / NRRL 3357 / JCM 12722 / SRRC 167) TaxID=332952 RepID=A0A7G5KDC1_ASPFN|nr:uncharacterized protein G4B84_009275 [Aspergillus flavus NRRL3357]KAJ1715659.1 hypothetical protein NYO67_2168 [Aspergillus flavus]QMW33809.1 hypothetical protein G4B84_009275 [Aspergillus flavus NRRL3357]QMW45863.1 hypothetical protein G4B11_009318 [Aspergillus flavus]QRD94486.1 hypothetical protein F9C07_11803 [Aspergillus flavus]UDD62643.1 hypothetical protein AFCA_009956 [Aspergillus flavus]
MLPRRLPSRLPGAIRPTRIPVHHSLRHPSRPFTQKSRLELVTPPYVRPQLPFLSPLASSRPVPPLSIHLRQHFARLISTESREHYKQRLYRGLRIGLSFYAILVLFQVIKLGVYQEEIEHQWPTPPEWSWKSRWCLRSAQALQHPEDIGKLMTNWPMVAGYLKELLERLEDPVGEGKGIVEQGDGGFLVEGVGKTGFDVSSKSEPWRRGYFQALMGAAKAAENLEGWLTDRKQRISAPAEYVVGPSNPRPKPMPAGQKKVPREEDCEQASPSPEVFYMKILTTRGFDTRQKLDAALAYADWLDYKGLQDTASDMYNWAMDIAASGSPVDAGKVVDVKTGVLKNDGKALPSENILRVSTALAVYHARHNNLPTALSIFTSVLKARRSLPPPPPGTIMPKLPSLHKSKDPFRYLFDSIKIMLVPVEYPAPLPSGNEPPLRTATSACDEAGLMTYIGEIIYASSSKEKGLAWTRDAVDTAEATMLELGESDRIPRHRCAECLRVGLENWKTMVSRLVAKAEKEEQESIQNAGRSWFGGQKQIEAKSVERKRWEAENLILDDRIRRLWPMIDGESGLEGIAPNSSLFV